MKITPEDILKKVENIWFAARQHDHEAAHTLEDALHRTVLSAIARGEAEDPAACSDAALRTTGIKFNRWVA